MTHTKIGTVLKPGDPIPPDVTGILDRDSDPWVRTERGHWHVAPSEIRQCASRAGGPCRVSSIELMLDCTPLTVVTVEGFISPASQPPTVTGELRLPVIPDEVYDGTAYLRGRDGDTYRWLPGGVFESFGVRPGWQGCLGHVLEREGGSVRVVHS